VGITQKVQPSTRLIQTDGHIVANPPNDLIYDFKGYFESSELSTIKRSSGQRIDEEMISPGNKQEDLLSGDSNAQRESLSLENTLWANTVLASSGHVLGMIVYTGSETRA
jgi:phospholipid-translocating ATPase